MCVDFFFWDNSKYFFLGFRALYPLYKYHRQMKIRVFRWNYIGNKRFNIFFEIHIIISYIKFKVWPLHSLKLLVCTFPRRNIIFTHSRPIQIYLLCLFYSLKPIYYSKLLFDLIQNTIFVVLLVKNVDNMPALGYRVTK